tara:strand:+ start:694 stop:1506 length:813 start_codon:yes stop_codon:yes gene_type:complete
MFETLRPKQWYKNIVVLAGIVFSFNLFNYSIYGDVFFAFMVFCLLSGSVYTINDIVDRKKDKIHPLKSKRPIASGRLKLYDAKVFSIITVIISLAFSFYMNVQFGLAALSYFILNIFYSFFLKNYAIIDVLLISIFFVIRAVAGCVVINVSISPWLILCSFFLALFLALGKRRNEVQSLGSNAKNHRPVLTQYSLKMIDKMVTVNIIVLIVSYTMYTFLSIDKNMIMTVPFIVFGLLRYIHLSHKETSPSEIEALLLDKPSVINMFIWSF